MVSSSIYVQIIYRISYVIYHLSNIIYPSFVYMSIILHKTPPSPSKFDPPDRRSCSTQKVAPWQLANEKNRNGTGDDPKVSTKELLRFSIFHIKNSSIKDSNWSPWGFPNVSREKIVSRIFRIWIRCCVQGLEGEIPMLQARVAICRVDPSWMVIPNDFLLLVTKQKPWGCEDHIVFSAKKTRAGFYLFYIFRHWNRNQILVPSWTFSEAKRDAF